MIERFQKRFFDMDYSIEKKCFFLSSFCALFLYLSSLIFGVIMNYGMTFLITILVFMVTLVINIYFAEMTGKYFICSIVMLVINNLITLPAAYLLNKTLICGITLFMIAGLVNCLTSLTGLSMLIMTVVTGLFMVSVVFYGYLNWGSNVLINSSRVFVEQLFGVLVCGIACGISIKCRFMFYEQERIKAEIAGENAFGGEEKKNIFLSNMSHEIRTPMNAILGTAQVLMDSDIKPQSKVYALNIINACRALVSIMGDIQNFSRYGRENEEDYLEEFSMTELIEDVINTENVCLIDRNIDFLVDIASDIPDMIKGDLRKLRSDMFAMLKDGVNNAGKTLILQIGYLEGEASEKCLKIAVKSEDYFKEFEMSCEAIETLEEESSAEVKEYKILCFEKNEECENIFRKSVSQLGQSADYVSCEKEFWDQLQSNHYDFIFINFHNYKELAERLRKKLGNTKLVVLATMREIKVEGNAGTVLTRPVYSHNLKAIFNGDSHSSLHRIALSSGFKCPGVKVMAVDDNGTNLQVLDAILGQYGISCRKALGGEECIYLLEEEKADIIFMDYMMPDMDGVDTLKAIRAMNKEWTKTIPVIVLTANTVGGVKEQLLKEGFDGYMSKPVEIRTLERMLLKFLPEDMIVANDEE